MSSPNTGGLSEGSSPAITYPLDNARRQRARRMSSRSSSPHGLSSLPATPTSTIGRSRSRSPSSAARAFGSSPYRGRGDVRAGRRYRTPSTPGDDGVGTPSIPSQTSQLNLSSDQEVTSREVWGTTINIQKSKTAFERFFTRFEEPDSTEGPLYLRLLGEAVIEQSYNINLNCQNLKAYDEELFLELVNFPSELVPLFDLVINEIKTTLHDSDEFDERIQVKPFNLPQSKNMRLLDPNDIDKLISVKGMIIRCGDIIPEMKTAFFQCERCNNSEIVLIEDGQINEPTICSNCDAKYSYQLIHNRGTYADMQFIKVQETPDSIPEGQTPHTISVYAFDNLVDVAKPGDRVEITGIFKARAMRVNRNKRAINSLYKTYVDAIHFKKIDSHRVSDEDSTADREAENFTSFEESDRTGTQIEEESRQLREISRSTDIYEKLTKSIAPNVHGLDDIKKGVLCLLFGGSNSELGAGHGRCRGEINILLCGDPGVAKSQLMQYVHKLAPRGIYTSGKGSSAVGLTAYVSKDPETKEYVLESGALVLSDRGICCIDEFDKMNDSTRSILHEVMEQQTVSIAKAGIVCSLNARTSILASANPIESRYNPNLSVVENLRLPPTLLSRFDLIYLVLDQPNAISDRKLAKHLVSLYYENVPESTYEMIPSEILTKYIAYARKHVHPKLSNDASIALVNEYVKIRSIGQGSGGKKIVTATPRQLEALIRLSEALARMKLNEIVTADDVVEASRLMAVATLRAATDQKTGRIDMGAITTGRSEEDKVKIEQQMRAISDLLDAEGVNKLSLNELLSKFNRLSGGEPLTKHSIRAPLEELALDGQIRIEKTRNNEFVHRI